MGHVLLVMYSLPDFPAPAYVTLRNKELVGDTEVRHTRLRSARSNRLTACEVRSLFLAGRSCPEISPIRSIVSRVSHCTLPASIRTGPKDAGCGGRRKMVEKRVLGVSVWVSAVLVR